jgi:flavorubredoxin
MKPIEIKTNIFWIGINDTSTRLFEGLWPVEKEGISYNSYLIKDQKNVLIDLCKDIFQDEYLHDLKSLIDPSTIDYLVINHMEPDHSGAMRAFRKIAPQATILATNKAVKMLDNFLDITENIQPVNDGDRISLGDKELLFITAPMVHWPETMMTYETSTQSLFSCDAFGGYGKLTGGIFDDDYEDISLFEKESLRYFSNIVAAFSKPVLNAADKLAQIPIKTIAPSHGLIWRSSPERIINLYLKWSGFSKEKAGRGVTLLHGSMYGNTTQMVPSIIDGLNKADIPVAVYDINNTHVSYILADLWINQGIVIGAPTYEGSIFPTMAAVLQMAKYKRVHNRHAAYFGSYGWGGGAIRYLKAQCEQLKWELVETLDFPGKPSSKNLADAVDLGERFGRLIKSI